MRYHIRMKQSCSPVSIPANSKQQSIHLPMNNYFKSIPRLTAQENWKPKVRISSMRFLSAPFREPKNPRSFPQPRVIIKNYSTQRCDGNQKNLISKLLLQSYIYSDIKFHSDKFNCHSNFIPTIMKFSRRTKPCPAQDCCGPTALPPFSTQKATSCQPTFGLQIIIKNLS